MKYVKKSTLTDSKMKAKKEAVERERENAIRKAMLFDESLHPMGKEKKNFYEKKALHKTEPLISNSGIEPLLQG